MHSFVIETPGSVTLAGAITVNGANGTVRGGGGSDGSIFITCSTFGGSGMLSANGGKGGAGTGMGGGGGGGRIAVRRTSHTFSGSATVAPGTGDYQAGNMGTLIWIDVPPKGTVFVVR